MDFIDKYFSFIIRYGFDKSRCQDAMDKNNGDIGRSLECLAAQCFDMPYPDYGLKVRSKPLPLNSPTWEEIDEERIQEKLVLESMYDGFSEKVPGHVWTVAIDVPSLTKYSRQQMHRKSRVELQMEQVEAAKDVCRFYLRGNCKFSRDRCRYRHETPEEKVRKDDEKDMREKKEKEALQGAMYILEVRFPPGNRYPFDTPFVLFCSNNELLPGDICLNISARLMVEAVVHANSGLAVVFSLINILEDEEQIQQIIEKPSHRYSLPEPLISRKQMLENAQQSKNRTVYSPPNSGAATEVVRVKDFHEQEEDGEIKEVVKKVKCTKKDMISQKSDPTEVNKINTRIKEHFRKKQVCSCFILWKLKFVVIILNVYHKCLKNTYIVSFCYL